MPLWLWGAAGVFGGLFAMVRFLVDAIVSIRAESGFPWGTFVINVSGSFALGFYLTLAMRRAGGRATARLFVATGFLGAYTTFSAFGYDTARLIQTGRFGLAGLNVAASLTLGMLGSAAGIAATRTGITHIDHATQ